MPNNYSIQEILYYLCKTYPFKSELSRSRLTKLIYLIDLEFYKKFHRQATVIEWKYDNYGPFTWDVHAAAQALCDETGIIEIVENSSMFGGKKIEYKIKEGAALQLNEFDEKIKSCVNTVIDATKKMNYNQFIKYVYQTAPMGDAPQYYSLDLSKTLFKENKPKILEKIKNLAKKTKLYNEAFGNSEIAEEEERKLFDEFKGLRGDANRGI